MDFTIQKLTIENFMGVRSASYDFNGKNVVVSGQNASGKTTIATAWFFLLGNCDYALKNNPAIFPLDVEECKPTVTANILIGKKPMKISKTQTRKVGKPDENGISKVAFTNSFAINDVPVSARDFESRLEEEGLQMDKFLALSHPDVFMSEKKDEQRKLLFAMASGVTDYDVASQIPECVDVAKLLRSYTLDEIIAMNKATLRKINEDYGKDGEILNAKIEGLESAKSDIDVAELELERNALNDKLAEISEVRNNIEAQAEAYNKASKEHMDLQFQKSDIEHKLYQSTEELRIKVRREADEIQKELNLSNIELQRIHNTIEVKTNSIDVLNKQLEDCRAEFTKAKELKQDENSFVCSFCGQDLPSDRIEEMKNRFNERKRSELERITLKGEDISKKVTSAIADIDSESLKVQDVMSKIAELEKKLTDKNAELDAIDDTKIDVESDPEYQAIVKAISDKAIEIDKFNHITEMKEELRGHEDTIRGRLLEVERKISVHANNARIDEQIADLRAKQMDYEQNRANAEKILYEVDLISRRKNELLTDSINKNFKMVQFKFFDYKKNSNYVEVCDAYVDGKKLGESMNTALAIKAKVDICNGLQNFYKQHYPVWLDNAEALDSLNKASVESDSQVVMLCVSEDEKVVIR